MFLKLRKVLFQGVRANAARAEHSGRPSRVIREGFGRAGLHRSGQKVHVKTRIGRAQVAAPRAVADRPLRMIEKKFFRSSLAATRCFTDASCRTTRKRSETESKFIIPELSPFEVLRRDAQGGFDAVPARPLGVVKRRVGAEATQRGRRFARSPAGDAQADRGLLEGHSQAL